MLDRRNHATWQLAWGLFFIFAGLLLLFGRFYGMFSFGQAFRLFWPLMLIALGLARLFDRRPIARPQQREDDVQSTSH